MEDIPVSRSSDPRHAGELTTIHRLPSWIRREGWGKKRQKWGQGVERGGDGREEEGKGSEGKRRIRNGKAVGLIHQIQIPAPSLSLPSSPLMSCDLLRRAQPDTSVTITPPPRRRSPSRNTCGRVTGPRDARRTWFLSRSYPPGFSRTLTTPDKSAELISGPRFVSCTSSNGD